MSNLEDALTAGRARELFDYNPDTGVFIWKPRPLSDFKTEGVGKYRNARFAGKEAGNINGRGYRYICVANRLYQAHRVAWLITYGRWPVDQIDHINQNRTDNRIANLREVTHQENQRNMPTPSDNTSGRVGVYWRKGADKWQASIRVDGRLIHLGLFARKESAIAERELAEIIHGFHKNHGSPKGESA